MRLLVRSNRVDLSRACISAPTASGLPAFYAVVSLSMFFCGNEDVMESDVRIELTLGLSPAALQAATFPLCQSDVIGFGSSYLAIARPSLAGCSFHRLGSVLE